MWSEAAGNFVRIDPVTGVVTDYPQALVPSGNAGAAWTYGNGNLGLNINSTGNIYQVQITNPNSASPTFALVSSSSGPASSGNDGTSCVGQPVDLGIATSAPADVNANGQITWTITVHNYGPGISSGYTVSDTVPSAVTGVSSPTAGCTVTGNVVQCAWRGVEPGSRRDDHDHRQPTVDERRVDPEHGVGDRQRGRHQPAEQRLDLDQHGARAAECADQRSGRSSDV